MRHRLHRLAFFFAFALAFLGQVSALPTPARSSTDTFYRRQEQGDPVSESVVTQTQQTFETDAGTVIETCTITLTPVNGPDGEPLVQVVRQCTLSAVSQPGSSSSSALTSTSSPPPSTTTSTSTSLSSTSISTTTSTSSSESTSITTSASSSVPSAVFSSIPLASVTVASSSSSSTPTPSSTVAPDPASSTVDPLPTSTPSEATTTSSPNNGTSVADNTTGSPTASAAASAFQIPGKKISVLPIGLGIFAGISVIALIVVGLVTYERTKYRKIFRQRKLAEQGAGPGYGGA